MTFIPNTTSKVDANNSTTDVRGINGVFVGVGVDVQRYQSVTVNIISNVNSATNGILLEFSTDNTNWRTHQKFTLLANQDFIQTVSITSQYFRVNFTNNSTVAQTTFRLQTILSLGVKDNVNPPLMNNFGEATVVSHNPIIQNYTPYGIISPQLFLTIVGNNGTVTPSPNGNEAELNISTTVNSFSILRSKRVLKYRPGLSMESRINAIFDSNAVVNSLQYVGVGNSACDLYFCMNGTNFSIRKSTNGKLQVVRFQITAASASSGSAIVTLNNVEFSINLTNAGGAIGFTALQVKIGGTGGGTVPYTGWTVESVNPYVYFIALSAEPRTGTYSFTSATTATATNITQKVGSDLTTEYINQADWNGESAMVTQANPFLRQMYGVEYTWYGSGNIRFKMMNPSTGTYETVHTLRFSNSTTELSLSEPNLYIQRGVLSLSSVTALTLKSAGSYGSVLGLFDTVKPRYSMSSVKSILANTETVIIVIKNRLSINGFANQSENIFDSISIATDGAQPVIIKLIKNPITLGANSTTDYNNYQFVSESESITIFNTSASTYTGGSTLFQTTVGKNLSKDIELANRNIYIATEDIMLITARSTGANVVTIAISVAEDL
jgi:hypothetical protein